MAFESEMAALIDEAQSCPRTMGDRIVERINNEVKRGGTIEEALQKLGYTTEMLESMRIVIKSNRAIIED